MNFTATIELNKAELHELITKALEAQGIRISHQDIEFNINATEKGTQRDSYIVYEVTGAKIKNVKIAREDR